MRKIEYEIKYNDDGKPYIHIENGNMPIEDIFFCFEMTKYRIFAILNDEKNGTLPKEALQELAMGGQIVSELSNRLGDMVIGSNSALDDANDILNSDDDK